MRVATRFRMPLAAAVGLLLLLGSLNAAAAELTFGVHPYLPAAELLARLTPLTDHLASKSGHRLTISIAPDYAEHIERTLAGRYDVAFLGPVSFVEVLERGGPDRTLARLEIRGSPTFHGIIFTRDDSPLTTLGQLAGQRMAFGDPHSTMSHLVPRHMLQQAGVPLERLGGHAFLRNHVNVVFGVLAGDFAAGAVKEDVFDEQRHRGLRVLARSPAISEHLFVARRGLDAAIVEDLRRAMLAVHTEPGGRELLNRFNRDLTALVPVTAADYDNLRRILHELPAEARP
ncbi:MAG: phosphate/phosphite/phosphonate ABC transporter substrate-binding protein [Chromatiales bacterium]|nr:phosphate/phosphite/phosphonate ABC transporter substrate-binding protein [Chromatiales bacterium]